MYTLIVNGVPALKLTKRTDIPPHDGEETWVVVNRRGKMVAYYLPLPHAVKDRLH